MSHLFQRLRYRHLGLHRFPIVELVSDHAASHEAVRWLASVNAEGRARRGLLCRPNADVTFDADLAPGAAIVAWCVLGADDRDAMRGRVEFDVTVQAGGHEATARQIVDMAPAARRRWLRLRLSAPAAGPSRIILRTRHAGGPDAAPDAIWGDPVIQTPRPLDDFTAVFRQSMARRDVAALCRLWWQPDVYQQWIRAQQPTRQLLQQQRDWSVNQTRIFSLFTIVDQHTDWPAARTPDSLAQQTYRHWEWLLIATPEAATQAQAIADRAASASGAVRVVASPAGASRAEQWNTALAAAAGDFGGLLEWGDTLEPTALSEVAAALAANPQLDLIYSDEDRLGADGRQRHAPRFKPSWSPDFLLSQNYIGRLAIWRAARVQALGGFHSCGDDPPSNDAEWDLWRRMTADRARVSRITRCLYHRGVDAPAVTARIAWPVGDTPLVSIVIPSRNAAAVVTQCLTGLLSHTAYPNLEVVFVDNGSTETDALALYRSLEADRRFRLVRFDRPFNFSAACNVGAAAAAGRLLLFLNNDIEVIDPEWLTELVGWARQPAIGIVGAKLLYPDRTIQHAGVVFGLGLVGHLFSRAAEGVDTPFGTPDTSRNYLAVTGACQLMRREVYDQLGGFDEAYRLSFSDIALCMNAWKAGYRVVYAAQARLVHHESYTRQREDWSEDLERLGQFLEGQHFSEDPFFHPELNAASPLPAVRPPFDPTPAAVLHDYLARVMAASRAR